MNIILWFKLRLVGRDNSLPDIRQSTSESVRRYQIAHGQCLHCVRLGRSEERV